MLLDLLVEHAFWSGPNLLVYHLSVLNKQNSGDRSNAKIHGQLRVLIHIDLAYVDFSFVFLGQRFDGWSQCQTGSAPFGPEVNDGKTVILHYFLLKIAVGVLCSHK